MDITTIGFDLAKTVFQVAKRQSSNGFCRRLLQSAEPISLICPGHNGMAPAQNTVMQRVAATNPRILN